jgi:hypothetical protein
MKINLPRLVILLIAVTGAGLVAWSTRGGIGAESDTASYITAARNLLNGDGFGIYYPSGRFVFFSYWAPLYALLMAGLSWISNSPFTLLRWIHVISFGAMILMVGWYFLYYSRSLLLSVMLSLLIAFSPLFLGVYVIAMSEPLYFLFGLAGIFGVLLYLDNQKRIYFYLSAAAMGMALLTRYSALPILATACLGLLLFLDATWRERIWKALEYTAISLAGLVVWFLLVWRNTGTLGGRQVVLSESTRQLFNEIKAWFVKRISSWVPGENPIPWMVDPHQYRVFWIVLAVILILAFGFLCWLVFRKPGSNVSLRRRLRGIFLSSCFIILYSAFLLISYVFSARFALVDRIFSPIELASLFLIFNLLFLVGRPLQKKPVFYTILVIPLVVWCGVNASRGVAKAMAYPADGLGYNTQQARSSLLLSKIRALPPEIQLISNEGPYLLFHVNRFPYLISEIVQETPIWDFSVYGSDPSDPAQQAFSLGQAALIIFPSTGDDFAMLYGDHVAERMQVLTEGLYIFYTGSDGTIYFAQKPEFIK